MDRLTAFQPVRLRRHAGPRLVGKAAMDIDGGIPVNVDEQRQVTPCRSRSHADRQ